MHAKLLLPNRRKLREGHRDVSACACLQEVSEGEKLEKSHSERKRMEERREPMKRAGRSRNTAGGGGTGRARRPSCTRPRRCLDDHRARRPAIRHRAPSRPSRVLARVPIAVRSLTRLHLSCVLRAPAGSIMRCSGLAMNGGPREEDPRGRQPFLATRRLPRGDTHPQIGPTTPLPFLPLYRQPFDTPLVLRV